MTGIFINSNEISLSCIELKHLSKLHEWYSNTDEYYYATGLKQPVTVEETSNNYFDILRSSNEALLGIFLRNNAKMIGVLKCRFTGDTVWINLLIIESRFQNMKYGTKSVAMLLDYLKKNCGTREAYLSVSQENIKGKIFWLKNGFSEFEPAGNQPSVILDNGNVIIMRKQMQP